MNKKLIALLAIITLGLSTNGYGMLLKFGIKQTTKTKKQRSNKKSFSSKSSDMINVNKNEIEVIDLRSLQNEIIRTKYPEHKLPHGASYLYYGSNMTNNNNNFYNHSMYNKASEIGEYAPYYGIEIPARLKELDDIDCLLTMRRNVLSPHDAQNLHQQLKDLITKTNFKH